ncbi:phage major capsid protein [Carbonactinospora thermoautotrophica]|uniref:phage major capsid protein n=1 Tax=Carbonactinospora thermoautotrophica TaxID=1469144 RepID=UPI00226F58BD|nr:phage major capsid protein [Carbonactinospora thermoautotrophica]
MDILTRANALLEERKRLHNEYLLVLNDATLSEGDKRERLKPLEAEIEAKGREVERLIRQAEHEVEQRAAMASAGPLGRVQVTEKRERFILPSFTEYRALSESSPGAGGVLVPAGQAGTYFDMLRANSVVLAAGPRVLPMDSNTLNVPRVSTSTAVAMVAEGANIAPSDLTLASVELKAKKAAALTLVNNELLADSNPAARDVVSEDHIKSVAAFLDAQFLAGAGTGENMRGIRNFQDVTVTPLGTNGGSLTLDALADAVGRLEGNNGNLNRAAWFMSGRSWASIRKAKDSQQRYQVSPDPTNDGPRRLFGIPVYVSNQISNAETVGTSNDCSWIALVDLDQVVIGRRQEITVRYSEDYAFNADQTAIRTVSRWDIAPLDPKGVELITGVRP